MQRAGHVILDGVIDPGSWASYKVTASNKLFHTFSYPLQLGRPTIADAEKTCNVFGDACVQAGKDNCKLLDLLNDGAKLGDMQKLVADGHDVRIFFPRGIYLKYLNPPDCGKVATSQLHQTPHFAWPNDGYASFPLAQTLR